MSVIGLSGDEAGILFCVLIGLVSGAPSASPVMSAVSDAARFSWEIPQGGLGSGVSFYAVSPAGAAVFLVYSDGMFDPLPNYRDRLVYQGNIAARNVTFTLRNIQTSDAGTYTCGAGGATIVIQNCGQKLFVLGKPTTPGPPVSTTPVYNQQVTLTCSCNSTTVPADHGLTLTYTWQRDNTDITVTSPGSPYTFTVSSRDSHSYRCRARESQGLESEWSQGYNVEPQYGPYQISLTPSTSSYTVTEQQALPSITCSALCRPGCSYRWLHNGTAFSNGAMLQGQAVRSKTGSYRCQPSNTHGSVDSVTVSVDVQYPATVSMFTANSHGGSVTVNESDPVTLRCQVDSNPRSVIRLLNGTEELTRADNSLTSEYRLESADCRQRGNYSCTATNNIGAPVSQRVVELLVKCSPRLDESVSQQLEFASRQGGNVNMSASVLAFPLPTFTWSRTKNTSYVQDLTGSSSPVSDISVTARLHLTNLQQQDFGDYCFTVNNGVGGSVAYTLSIVSEGPPSTPTNVSVYPEGPFSLHVSWKEEFNGGASQTFTVEYSTDEEDWKTAGSHEETGRGNYLTSVIRDLNSGTVYYVRVVASNKFGNSTSTEHVTGLTGNKVDSVVSHAALIGGVTGSLCVILLVAVVAGGLMIRHRRKKGDDTKRITSKGRGTIRTSSQSEMQDNVCYASSDEVMKPGASGCQGAAVSDVYAAVDKKKLKPASKPNEVYAEVQKPGNKKAKKEVAKKDKAKKATSNGDKTPLKTKNRKGKKGEVYENTGIGEEGNPHLNHAFDDQPEDATGHAAIPAGAKAGRNNDGLLYVGIDFSNQRSSPHVHRDQDSTEYAGIQIGVVGPSLAEKEEET